MSLARVPVKLIAEKHAYEYWSAGTWSKEAGSAQTLFGEAPRAGSISYNEHLKSYLMIYSRFVKKDVVARTAPEPWGPWSAPKVIWKCKRPLRRKGSQCTGAREHFQYSENKGRTIYFTLVDPDQGVEPKIDVYQVTFEPTAEEEDDKDHRDYTKKRKI